MKTPETKPDPWSEFRKLDVVGTPEAREFVHELAALNGRIVSSGWDPKKSGEYKRVWTTSGDLYSQVLGGVSEPDGSPTLLTRDYEDFEQPLLEGTETAKHLSKSAILRVPRTRVMRGVEDIAVQCRMAEFETARPVIVQVYSEHDTFVTENALLLPTAGSRILSHLLSRRSDNGLFFQPEVKDLILVLAILEQTDPVSLAADWARISQPEQRDLIFHGGSQLLDYAEKASAFFFVEDAEHMAQVLSKVGNEVSVSMLNAAGEKMVRALDTVAQFENGQKAARAIEKANGDPNRVPKEYAEVFNLLGTPGTAESRKILPTRESEGWVVYTYAAGCIVAWERDHPGERGKEGLQVPDITKRDRSDFDRLTEIVADAQSTLGVTEQRPNRFSDVVRGKRAFAGRDAKPRVIRNDDLAAGLG